MDVTGAVDDSGSVSPSLATSVGEVTTVKAGNGKCVGFTAKMYAKVCGPIKN